MRHKTLISLYVALLAIPALMATAQGTPAVGENAPELGPMNWITGPSGEISIDSLAGEVLIIERWGVRCPPCIRMIPHLQKLHEKYGARGLHILAIESQNSSLASIHGVLDPRGVTYRVATNGGHAYRGPGRIPYAWVVGVDGKIIWQGNPAQGMDAVVEAELAKVRYPGLGKAEIHAKVVGAAQRFSGQDYVGARREATRIAEDQGAEEGARADAHYLLSRINDAIEQRLGAATSLDEERRYLDAIVLYEEVARQFRGLEEAGEASARIREMKRDRSIRREMQADQALAAFQKKIDPPRGRKPTPAQIRAGLESFVRKYRGTRAAEEVEANLVSVSP